MEKLRLVRKQWGLPALLVVMLLWVMDPVRFYADQADSLTMDLSQMETFYNFLSGHKFCTYVFVDDIREGDDRIEVDPAQLRLLKADLCSMIDPEKDSLRFYHLGKVDKAIVEHFGTKEGYKSNGFLSV